MADKPSAITLNIKHHIPLVLDMDNVHYSSWAELFKITARANQVLDHIIPPTTPKEITDKELWNRLDAVVLQWIYGTISEDLMLTILEPDSTAQQAWERLRDIFQDNKHSRAVYLENQFSNTHLENFKNVSAYCQLLKLLSDQLAGVGSPVSDQRLVLQLVAGLTDAYDNVASLIQQSEPLYPFYKARSMLTLEESRKSQQLGSFSSNALVASTEPLSTDGTDEPPTDTPTRSHSTSGSRGRGGGVVGVAITTAVVAGVANPDLLLLITGILHLMDLLIIPLHMGLHIITHPILDILTGPKPLAHTPLLRFGVLTGRLLDPVFLGLGLLRLMPQLMTRPLPSSSHPRNLMRPFIL